MFLFLCRICGIHYFAQYFWYFDLLSRINHFRCVPTLDRYNIHIQNWKCRPCVDTEKLFTELYFDLWTNWNICIFYFSPFFGFHVCNMYNFNLFLPMQQGASKLMLDIAWFDFSILDFSIYEQKSVFWVTVSRAATKIAIKYHTVVCSFSGTFNRE